MADESLKTRELGRRIASLLGAAEWRAVLDEKPNFWHILQIGQKYEVWYSRMLRWLMDPQENHGLGTWFLERVLQLAGYDGPVSPHTRVTENLHHIDVLVFDEVNQVVLAIENKTTTRLHVRSGTQLNQIDAYYELLAGRPVVVQRPGGGEKQVQVTDYQSALERHPSLRHILLTPYGEDKPTEEHPQSTTYAQHWTQLSYADLEPALEGAMLRAVWNHDLHTKKLIEDFSFDQRRKHTRRDRARVIADLFGDFAAEIEALVGHANIADAVGEDENDPDGAEPGDAEMIAVGETTSPQERERVWNEVTQAITGEGVRLDEYEFRVILQTIWSDRPREIVQDHSKDPRVQKEMREFVAPLIGLEAEKIVPGLRYRAGDALRAVGIAELRISGGGQGLDFFAEEGAGSSILYLSGTGTLGAPIVFPSVMHVVPRHKGETSCQIGDLKSRLVRIGSPSERAVLFAETLQRNRQSAGTLCGCVPQPGLTRSAR